MDADGPALLAHIVVSKFQDSLPLYRQCQIYERAGVTIAPSTIGDWTAFAIEALEPIATRITGRAAGRRLRRIRSRTEA